MARQKSVKRYFQQMSYREVQQANSTNRSKLKTDAQKWLKANGYRNVGWDNVIKLYEKITEFLDNAKFEDMSLEDLFLEADRIGNKYQTPEEIDRFNQQLSQEVAEIGDLIDEQFPDTESEVIDFSRDTARKPRRNPNQRTYRTTKL